VHLKGGRDGFKALFRRVGGGRAGFGGCNENGLPGI
jgi:hypothetical protein